MSATEESLAAVQQERDALVADTQSRAIEMADAKMQLALQQDQAQSAEGKATAEVEELRARLDSLTIERNGLAGELAGLREMSAKAESDLAKAQAITAGSAVELASKDAALNEAYQRVVNLQRIVEEREAAQANAQAELIVVKNELAAAQVLPRGAGHQAPARPRRRRQRDGRLDLNHVQDEGRCPHIRQPAHRRADPSGHRTEVQTGRRLRPGWRLPRRAAETQTPASRRPPPQVSAPQIASCPRFSAGEMLWIQ